MKLIKTITLLSSVALLGACSFKDKSTDGGFAPRHLSQLVAGVWVDPNGCDHWIIDDGVEGYLSQRLDQYGKPVCSGVAEPNTATGPFKRRVPDIF